MAREQKKFIVFKILIAVGFVLGLVLLVQTISTYWYVSGAMLAQEAERDAQRRVNTLVGAVRSAQTQDLEKIQAILQEMLEDWSEQVEWVRILDGQGRAIAAAGPAPLEPVSPDKLPRPFVEDTPIPDRRESEHGPVLVSIRSFRTVPLGPPPTGTGQRAASGSAGVSPGQPQLNQGGNPGGQRAGGGRGGGIAAFNWSVEIAILPESVSTRFASLRRNMIIGVSASLTLMAALILIAFRFPYYLRGQQIERELELARRVQADLLPSAETISPYVDFSAECISAWQVGGDFCDVFHVAEERTALVLGDVSGKGISAALLMALVHGAIHSVSWTRSTQDHVNSTRRLNSLLCKKTASERFTSLFWGCFDPQHSTLQYINAGHLPPLLLRMVDNHLQIERLEAGGPVLGLLPDANYQQGEQFVAPGDVLVAFSDGVVEATNTAGVDFGEERLIATLRECWNLSAADIRQTIHKSLKAFTDSAPVADDQTLIVVRFKHSASAVTSTLSNTAAVAQQ